MERSRESHTEGIIVVATTSSVALGFMTASAIALATLPIAEIRYHLLTLEGLRNLLIIGGSVSLPISIPAGLAGGILAARIASRQINRRSLWSWIARGAVWGAAVGAICTFAFLILANNTATDTSASLFFLVMAIAGSTTGAAVGLIVGAYCSRANRLSEVSDA